MVSLADSNHVVMRALEPLERQARSRMADTGNGGGSVWLASMVEWAGAQIERERARIAHALAGLYDICRELEAAGCAATVMKSLDHYPDLGSDLDLYTTADESAVAAVMTRAVPGASRSPQLGRPAGAQVEFWRPRAAGGQSRCTHSGWDKPASTRVWPSVL